MEARAENGFANCLVGIPRCLRGTARGHLFCVAGLEQCVVCCSACRGGVRLTVKKSAFEQ
jgi:hypothetical protein